MGLKQIDGSEWKGEYCSYDSSTKSTELMSNALQTQKH